MSTGELLMAFERHAHYHVETRCSLVFPVTGAGMNKAYYLGVGVRLQPAVSVNKNLIVTEAKTT